MNQYEQITALRTALIDARELLLERSQGSPARSASHNARLVIEAALAATASAAETDEQRSERLLWEAEASIIAATAQGHTPSRPTRRG